MKDNYIKRAIYNKNSDEALIKFLDEAGENILNKPRKVCMHGSIKDGNAKQILGHIYTVAVFIYKMLRKKGLEAKFRPELLQIDVKELKDYENVDYEKTKQGIKEIDEAYLELFRSIDLTSFNTSDYSYDKDKGPMEGHSIASWIEQFFSHQIHHRGQLHQIITEEGIGQDISRFIVYHFENVHPEQ